MYSVLYLVDWSLQAVPETFNLVSQSCAPQSPAPGAPTTHVPMQGWPGGALQD
jgi:hypothetical protein